MTDPTSAQPETDDLELEVEMLGDLDLDDGYAERVLAGGSSHTSYETLPR